MGLNFSDCYEKKNKDRDRGEDKNSLNLKTTKKQIIIKLSISEGLIANRLKEETTTLEDERNNSYNSSSSDKPRKMEIAEKFLLNYSSSNSNNENFPNSSLNLEYKFFLFILCHLSSALANPKSPYSSPLFGSSSL